ncbi:MAG: bifunctional nicotinamidase/pyrazinamidase [Bacteroidota bacterium]
MKALLIIDLQNDFLPGGSLEVENGDVIIPVINSISPKFDLVLATQDWHPANHISFASNNKDAKPFDTIEINGMEQIMWPDHCVQGTKGAQISSELDEKPIEAIFRKGMDPEIDSYSGFYDLNYKKDTGLAGYLRARKVKRLFIAGLAADVCVYFSTKDALREGFETYLIDDATRAINDEKYIEQKKEHLNKGVKIISSADISAL